AATEHSFGNRDDFRLPRVGIIGGNGDAVLANGPYRLVGEQDFSLLLVVGKLGKGAAHFFFQHFSRASAFAVFQRFADADERDQAVAHGGFDLEANRFDGLVEMLATLRVTKLNNVDIAVLQHQRRNFSGPCALIGPLYVLRADLDRGAGQDFLHFANGGERWN